MKTRDRGFNSLYFLLFVLSAMLVTALLAPTHEQNVAQKIIFTIGMGLLIIGSIWRIVQRTRKEAQTRGVTVQVIGTIIAVLTALSGIFW